MMAHESVIAEHITRFRHDTTCLPCACERPPASGTADCPARRVSAWHENNAKEIEKLDYPEKEAFLYKFMAYDPQVILERPELVKSTLTPAQAMAANKALENFDYRADLHRITAKTLVISGKYDGLNPPSEGRLCASLIPNAMFVEMQYSGHVPMVEEAELYDHLINEFLRS